MDSSFLVAWIEFVMLAGYVYCVKVHRAARFALRFEKDATRKQQAKILTVVDVILAGALVVFIAKLIGNYRHETSLLVPSIAIIVVLSLTYVFDWIVVFNWVNLTRTAPVRDEDWTARREHALAYKLVAAGCFLGWCVYLAS